MAIRQPGPIAERNERSKYHGRRMSEAEYLALPEEKPYLEYVDGVVLEKPLPDAMHRRLVRFLEYVLYGYQLTAGGEGGPEGRIRLPDGRGYRLPDTAHWVKGRPAGNDSIPSASIEIRSRRQSLRDLRDKCRSFRANGVDVCWLIDPYDRWVEVFEGERDGVRLPADSALETPVMPGFSVPQADLWKAIEGDQAAGR